MEQGCVGMSDDEKEDFVGKVVEKVKIYDKIETAPQDKRS